MISVEFEWEDGYVQVVEYPKNVRGLRHNGLRPIRLTVCVNVHSVEVVEWINECHFTLESSG